MQTASPKTLVKVGITETAAEGLCSTCSHVAGCALRARQTSNVHWCEEFDAYITPPTPVSDAYAQHLTAPSDAETRDEAPTAQTSAGLCSNCEGRLSCEMPRTSSAVYFCEEYR